MMNGEKMNFRETLKINEKKHLEICNHDCVELAKKFGTPLYVFDEVNIRKIASAFKSTMEKEYGNGGVAYASKAFCTEAIYKIISSEGLYADVVSGGEIYTAIKAGFDTSKMYFHGNNKSEEELVYAVKNNIGTVVVDSLHEMDLLENVCSKLNKKQNVLIRINPGVEAHTHHYVQTAKIDSKFGLLISNGDALTGIKNLLKLKHIKFNGLHCHIGSQIFDKNAFTAAIDTVTDFVKKCNIENIKINELNFGGGFGIYYTDEDPKFTCDDYCGYVSHIAKSLSEAVDRKGIEKPFLMIEPGRAIVGESGLTLYTAGTIKNIKDIRKYVCIDGGMFDNPRYALYKSKYEIVNASKADMKADDTVTIAGKCCESGDLIAENIKLPKNTESGDIIAVLSTGAYNYSMASNYNRNLIPPVVLVNEKFADYIVKPQSYEDLVRNDKTPDWLK